MYLTCIWRSSHAKEMQSFLNTSQYKSYLYTFFFCIFFIIHEEQIELFKTAAFVFVCLETNFKSVF